MKNNPLTIIKDDHMKIETLMKEYEGLSDTAVVHRQKVVLKIIQGLTDHAEMEEAICYPEFKKVFSKEEDKMVDEAYIEHEGIKRLLRDLNGLDPKVPEFDARVTVLIEQVRHHVAEEEGNVLPRVEKEIPKDKLETMGDEMVAFKETQALMDT